MRIKVLYDQGSARVPEDGIIFQPPCYYGAMDGISGVYLPHEGPRLFDGRTGGQFATHAISIAFETASEKESLESILQKANTIIREFCETNNLSLKESGFLPSAAFVVTSIDTHNINILQGGDSLAVWLMRDGTIGGIPNRTFAYEKELLHIIAELMRKHREDRQKMWEEFIPILIDKRRANINNTQGGFALLNGQSEVKNFWQKFSLQRKEISLIILFSDGFVPFEWTEDEKSLGERVVSLYQKGGLYQVIKDTQSIAKQKRASSHEDYAEATAIAIEF